MSHPDPTHTTGTYTDPARPLPGTVTATPQHRMMRSRGDAWIGGVCGGIAARFGWDSTLVRVLFVLSILLPGPQFLLYLVLWLVIPREPAL